MKQTEKRDHLIKEWIKEAAMISKNSFNNELIVQEKTNRTDLVTNIDKEIEQFFLQKINHYFPEERVLGEEGSGHQITDLKGIVWIIDPIDGTLNFVNQQNDFAIMISVYEDGVGQSGYIYDVMRDELYTAYKGQGAYLNGQKLPRVKDKSLKQGLVAISYRLISKENNEEAKKISKISSGVRMIGSAGLETVHVATGRLVAYLGASLAPWDIAAGKIIAEEVGLLYTQLDGRTIDLLNKNATIVATPSVHKEVIEFYRNGSK